MKRKLSHFILLMVIRLLVSSQEDTNKKISDYIKFNLELGGAIYDSYTNVTSHTPPDERVNGNTVIEEKYSPLSSNKKYFSINPACNLIIGKSTRINFVIGSHYIQSKGQYAYYRREYEPIKNNLGYKFKIEDLEYKTNIGFLGLYSGIKIRLLSKLYFSPTVNFNIPLFQNNEKSGIEATQNEYGIKDTIYYDKYKTDEINVNTIPSFTLKLSYEFQIKDHRTGLYIGRNIGYFTHLPWWMIGITYYPFKKLR